MAKSSRSSAVKKNNQILKKKVFRPVEVARNERLSAKLLGLARQPKGLATEMEIDKDGMCEAPFRITSAGPMLIQPFW